MNDNIVSVIRGNIDHTNSMLDFFDELADSLVTNSMNHTLYCYEPSQSNIGITNYGKSKVIVAKSNRNIFLALLHFIVFCLRTKPSILIGHYSLPMSMVATASLLTRIPAIGVIHTPPSEKEVAKLKNRIKAKFFNMVFKKIITVSEGTKSSALAMGINENRIKRIYHGINCMEYTSNIPSSDLNINTYASPVILLPASLTPVKNHLFLLHALSKIKDRTFTVLLAGDGPLKQRILDAITQLDLADKVFLIGQRNDLKAIFSMVHCVLLVSDKEGLPRVILEAMCFKKPVIGTNVDGINEAIIDYRNGRLVEHGNIEKLSDCLINFIENKDDWASMGTKGYEMVNGKFQIQNTVSKYISLINSHLQ